MAETILVNRGTCYACAVACKREVEVKELGVTPKFGGPEYETLAASGSYRIREVLDSGAGAVYRTNYLLQAPDRARWHLDTGSGTTDTIFVGEDRYTRDGTGPWKKETTPGLALSYPARNWTDQEGNVVVLGAARIGSTPVRVLAFIDLANGAYHRLWVDRANLILRERMHAPGHFMDRDYFDYGAAVTITPPATP